MVEFQQDDDPETSGNGTFLLNENDDIDLSFIHYENLSKCNVNDKFLVDRPPHNSDYFLLQMLAVKNYYNTISNGSIDFEIEVINTVFQMDYNMKYYSTGDDKIGLLFSESIDKVYATNSLEVKNLSEITDFNINDDILYVVFHAGLGQESSTDFDPTIYDIRSAFIEGDMLDSEWDKNIDQGIVLPETLNMIYYDIIEDAIPLSQDIENLENVYCDSQYGMSGLFSYLLGYAFGYPPLHNFENGQTRVGVFDLMDVGFFNGRGVIPSPPSAWIRNNNNFNFNINSINITEDINNSIDDVYEIPVRLSEFDGSITDQIFKIDIGIDEYFLIEHRKNLLSSSSLNSIDERYSQFKDYFNLLNNQNSNDFDFEFPSWFNVDVSTYKPAWFDVLINEFPDYIQVDGKNQVDDNLIPIPSIEYPENNYGVITQVSNYDAGLPGSGLLIWHINEPQYNNGYDYGINDDILNKAITLEEGDGSQDIGELNPGIIAVFENEDFQTGKGDDFWYSGNTSYIYNNGINDYDISSKIYFSNFSFPSSKSTNGVPTNISIRVIPPNENTPDNIIEIERGINDFNPLVSEIIIIDDAVEIIGNNGNGCIYYLDSENLIFDHCIDNISDEQIYFYDDDPNPSIVRLIGTKDSSIIGAEENFPSFNINYPEILFYNNSLYLVESSGEYYLDEDNQAVSNSILHPRGYYEPVNENIDLIEVDSALSLGNLDNDVYDEKVFINEGDLYAQNYNESFVNGFPIQGQYTGFPLILNISDDYPGSEIICTNGDKIDILSNYGHMIYDFPLFSNTNIATLKWDDDVALINGNRLYVFEDAYDADLSFWMNYKSNPSNFSVVTGLHDVSNFPNYDNFNGIDLDKIYNYPNPITNNSTTFRFFVFDSNSIEINVYDITGYKVKKLFKDNLTHNEYNEIFWDSMNLPNGLYFASVKSDLKQSKILKVVVE